MTNTQCKAIMSAIIASAQEWRKDMTMHDIALQADILFDEVVKQSEEESNSCDC